jgi:two-component system nitrogen regulation response regulator NtrX
LEERIADGKFREDLYYRLSVVPIRVPALRERLQDVRDLATYFLAEFCTRNNFRKKTFDEDVLQLLERHHWPGNIRELRNTVERMAILSPEDRIPAESIPLEIRTPPPSRTSGLHEVHSNKLTGTSPAPRGCWASNARTCTSG